MWVTGNLPSLRLNLPCLEQVDRQNAVVETRLRNLLKWSQGQFNKRLDSSILQTRKGSYPHSKQMSVAPWGRPKALCFSALCALLHRKDRAWMIYNWPFRRAGWKTRQALWVNPVFFFFCVLEVLHHVFLCRTQGPSPTTLAWSLPLQLETVCAQTFCSWYFGKRKEGESRRIYFSAKLNLVQF